MINIGACMRTVLMIFTLVLPIAALTVYNGLAQRKQAEGCEDFDWAMFKVMTRSV